MKKKKAPERTTAQEEIQRLGISPIPNCRVGSKYQISTTYSCLYPISTSKLHSKTYTIPIQYYDLRHLHWKSCFHIVTHSHADGEGLPQAGSRCLWWPAQMSSSLGNAASVVFKSVPLTPPLPPKDTPQSWEGLRLELPPEFKRRKKHLEHEILFSLYFCRRCAGPLPNPLAGHKFSLPTALDQGMKQIQDPIPQRAKCRNRAYLLQTAPRTGHREGPWRFPGSSSL